VSLACFVCGGPCIWEESYEGKETVCLDCHNYSTAYDTDDCSPDELEEVEDAS
jgi:hypothetical protein